MRYHVQDVLGRWHRLGEHGELRVPAAWTPDLAQRLAVYHKVPGAPALSRDHWRVINHLRLELAASRPIPTTLVVCRDLDFTLSGLYALYPLGLSQAAKVAGVPRPDCNSTRGGK